MESVKEDEERVDAEVDDLDDSDEAEDLDRTVVMTDDEDYEDSDISMEVNVEKLVAEFEKADAEDSHRRAEIRRRLEELTEHGELEDTYAIDFDD